MRAGREVEAAVHCILSLLPSVLTRGVQATIPVAAVAHDTLLPKVKFMGLPFLFLPIPVPHECAATLSVLSNQ